MSTESANTAFPDWIYNGDPFKVLNKMDFRGEFGKESGKQRRLLEQEIENLDTNEARLQFLYSQNPGDRVWVRLKRGADTQA